MGHLTAIDILLLPDDTMVRHAEAVNARLRSVYPNGYSLDASHHPHISLFQCFVPTANLEKVYAAADQVFADVSREGDSAAIGELLQAISDVVSALQDRVIEALEGNAGPLIGPVSPVPPSRWLH